MSLSEEQRKKIEENRQRALALRANKPQSVPGISATNIPSSNTVTGNQCRVSSVAVTGNHYKPSSVAAVGNRTSNFSSTGIKNDQKTQYFQNKAKYGNGKKQSSTASIFSASSETKKPEFSLGKDSGVITASCLLLSRDRFAVDSKYFAPLIELFKTMNTRQYDVQKKQWSFSLQDYTILVSQIREKLGKAVTVEELPKSVVKALTMSSGHSVPEANLSKVESKLVMTLLPFQRDGVNFAIHHDGRILLADDMGLGKTIQALCIASYYRSEWPLLIVVPSSVRFAWQQQILDWLPTSVDPQQINVVLSSKDSSTSGLINIVSYDLMVKHHSELVAKNFKVIIMDESHFLKNSKTARTKKALPLLKKASRVILLSGTPALSRPAELYTQLSAVNSKLFPYFHEYGIRYCAGKQMQWGWDYTGSSNMTELQIILEEKVMIRRMKKDVLHQLPSKYRTMIILDPGSVSVSKTMKFSHEMVNKVKGNERRGALLEYFHTTGLAKIKAVKEYVLDLLESEHKFLLFAHHQAVLDAVEDAVQSKYKYMRIDGKTTPEQRNYFCDKFQDDESVRIAILSITAANAGLNLTAASLVVFGELFWNPGILVQAEDSVHRIGQEDSVNIQYLVARNTADDYIWPMIQQKLSVLSKAGLSKDDFDEAETKQLQDPKQREILEYFDEELFPDADTDDSSSAYGSSISSTAETCGHSYPTPNSSSLNQKTIGRYFKTSDNLRPNRKSSEDTQDSDATVDWAEGVDDVIEDILEDDFDLEEPLPKKSKLY